MPRPFKKVTDDLRARVKAQRAKGLSLSQLSEMFGISIAGASKIINRKEKEA